MNFILKAKAYQIFIGIIFIPIGILCGIQSIFLSGHQSVLGFIGPVLLFSGTGLFVFWYYSVGKLAIRIGGHSSKFRVPSFKFYLFFPISYLVFMGIILVLSILFNRDFNPMYKSVLELIYPIMTPLLLTAFISTLYSMYYVSMALSTAISGTVPKSIKDHALLFIAIWTFPIGIWYVQPFINGLNQKR